MISKKELLNRIESLENRPFEPEIPITHGNRFQAQTEFDAILKMNYDGVEQKNPFKPFGLWFEILQLANYFGCLVNIKTESKTLLRYWSKIQQLAFIFGLVGVEVVGDKLRIWGITNYKISDLGDYYDLKGITWNQYLTTAGGSPDLETFKSQEQKIDETKVFVLSNNLNNLNVWLTWVPFLKARNDLLDRLDDVVLSNMKNYVVSGTAENPDEINKMIRALRSPKTAIFNFAFKEQSGKLNVNKLNVDTLDTRLADMNEFLALVDWFNCYWYQILGKRTNNSFKRERNVQAEVDASTASFDVLESYIFDQSQALLSWLEEQNSEFKAEIVNYKIQDDVNVDEDHSLNGAGPNDVKNGVM